MKYRITHGMVLSGVLVRASVGAPVEVDIPDGIRPPSDAVLIDEGHIPDPVKIEQPEAFSQMAARKTAKPKGGYAREI